MQRLLINLFAQSQRIDITGDRCWLGIEQNAPHQEDKPSERGFSAKDRAECPQNFLKTLE